MGSLGPSVVQTSHLHASEQHCIFLKLFFLPQIYINIVIIKTETCILYPHIFSRGALLLTTAVSHVVSL